MDKGAWKHWCFMRWCLAHAQHQAERSDTKKLWTLRVQDPFTLCPSCETAWLRGRAKLKVSPGQKIQFFSDFIRKYLNHQLHAETHLMKFTRHEPGTIYYIRTKSARLSWAPTPVLFSTGSQWRPCFRCLIACWYSRFPQSLCWCWKWNTDTVCKECRFEFIRHALMHY